MNLIKKARNDLIVLESKRLFLKKGIDEVTMTEIATHLSMGEATLYRYFGKKQNIVIEVATLIWEEIYSNLQVLEKKSTGYENVDSFFRFFLDVYQNNPEFFAFVDEFDLKIIQDNFSCDELDEYEKTILKFKDIFDVYFEQGLKDGSIKGNIDKDIFYFSTNHALLGLCKKLTRKQQLLKYENEIEAYSQINTLIEMCLSYIKMI